MDNTSWFAKLEQAQTSYLLLGTLAVTVLVAGILYQIGLIGWVLRGLGRIVRGGIRSGFLLWERLLAWASWPLFLAIVFGLLLVGGVTGGPLPALRVLFGLATLLMGAIACLAYMFIDLERNELSGVTWKIQFGGLFRWPSRYWPAFSKRLWSKTWKT